MDGHRVTQLFMFLMGVAIVATFVGYKEAAAVLLVVVLVGIYLMGQVIEKQQADIQTLVEELNREPEPEMGEMDYIRIVQDAMAWQQAGKTVFVPEGQDKKHPQIIYVGHAVNGGSRKNFLPQFEITHDYIEELHFLDQPDGVVH